jgi:hypothetical protein
VCSSDLFLKKEDNIKNNYHREEDYVFDQFIISSFTKERLMRYKKKFEEKSFEQMKEECPEQRQKEVNKRSKEKESKKRRREH